MSFALRSWLPSQRPSWAMMPRVNADLMVDLILTTASVLEQHGVAYTAHQGSLLGAARLSGLLPWDIDADLAVMGENAETLAQKVQRPLHEHGIAMVFSKAHYYYTFRPMLCLGAAKHVLAVPLVEVILATATRDETSGDVWHDRHSPHRAFAPGELFPLQCYPWHGSYLMGPQDAEHVLGRLYGHAGGPRAFEGFHRAEVSEETELFWRQARPMNGVRDSAAILQRAQVRRHDWARVSRSIPWYLANGVYNAFTETVRRSLGAR
jgi:LicD family